MEGLPKNKKILLFDGVCHLCNSSVQYIIKHDSKDLFRFVALQSELGQKISTHIGVDIAKVDSVLLYIPKVAYYTKADAVLIVAKDLDGFISFLYYLKFFPNFIKNTVYDFIAKKRYEWFVKKDSCILPIPEINSKFLV
jgi:predicted DCC family thiol-disulfide oxidoreductase YuxK